MKRIVIIILFLLCIGITYGQLNNIKENCKSEFDLNSIKYIYTFVDSMPEFPGGIDSLNEFIKTNLKWPKDDGLDYNGSVYISVIVETNGSLSNKKIIRGIYGPADNEALKLINKMPKWKPGKCNGILVPVKLIIPIKFVIYQ